ncbi:MAG: hypothetical protein GY931_04275 [Maribacter sp.]|nr:hypothetical protein [Maribacter sp.]
MSYSQESELSLNVQKLNDEIVHTEGSRKLKLLDSLTNLIQYNSKFEYEDVVRKTIEYAFNLDSLEIATRQTSKLIFYMTNRAGKPYKARLLFERFQKRKINIENDGILANLYCNAGDSYFFSGDIEKSISLYEKAELHSKRANDPNLEGKVIGYKSDALAKLGKFAEASISLSQAEELAIKTNDTTNIMSIKMSRANLYSRIGFFEEAKIVRDEIISIAEKRKDTAILIPAYGNSALDNRRTNSYYERIKNLQKGLSYAKTSTQKDVYVPKFLNYLLLSYALVDSLEKAREVLKEIDANPERNKEGDMSGYYSEALMHYEFSLGNYAKAISLGNELLVALGRKSDFSSSSLTHKFLAKAYKKVNNDEKAYYHHQIYSEIQDSIIGLQNVRALTYYQTLYETEKRDAIIESQIAEIKILDIENEIKTQWIIFGGIVSLVLFTIVYLIRTKQFANKRHLIQEEFTQELFKTQEEERKRLARDLHDSVGQKLMLLTKKTKISADESTQFLASSTLEELRNISRGLHPLNIERFGITKSIELLVNQIDSLTSIFFTQQMDNIDEVLSKEAKVHLYRIVQEALNNIVKHSEAKAVMVSCEKQENIVEFKVVDNGKGFDYKEKIRFGSSFGMQSLLERAKVIGSKINIKSSPNHGTEIKLSIPI